MMFSGHVTVASKLTCTAVMITIKEHQNIQNTLINAPVCEVLDYKDAYYSQAVIKPRTCFRTNTHVTVLS